MRRYQSGKIIDTLIPFFVTRQVFAGAGKLLHTARGTVFSLAQRAEQMTERAASQRPDVMLVNDLDVLFVGISLDEMNIIRDYIKQNDLTADW